MRVYSRYPLVDRRREQFYQEVSCIPPLVRLYEVCTPGCLLIILLNVTVGIHQSRERNRGSTPAVPGVTTDTQVSPYPNLVAETHTSTRSSDSPPSKEATAARKRLLDDFASYDVISKRIRNIPCSPGSSQDRVQLAIRTRADLFLQKNMFPLQVSFLTSWTDLMLMEPSHYPKQRNRLPRLMVQPRLWTQIRNSHMRFNRSSNKRPSSSRLSAKRWRTGNLKMLRRSRQT